MEQKIETSLIMATLEAEQITGGKAEMIETAFAPMVEMLRGFEAEFKEVSAKQITNEVCIEARALRLKMVKVRTGAGTIHKEQKAEVLRFGRAIDGVKNILEFAVVDKEKALEKIEKHFENIEKERINDLRSKRQKLLDLFNYNIVGVDIGLMSDETFEDFLAGAKKRHFDKIEADKKAEEERIEKERLDAEQKEVERLESERLKLENAQKEKELAIAKQQNDKLQADLKAKEEAELKAKQKAQLEEKERIKAEKKLAKAPDKQKLIKWIDDLTLPPIELNQPASMILAVDLKEKLDKYKVWAKSQIEIE